jgi:hypothetical protein
MSDDDFLVVCVLSGLILVLLVATQGTENKMVDMGFSGYVTSTAEIDNIITIMDEQGLNIFRMSFNPSWTSYQSHAYNSTLVQHFLDSCSYNLIVDRNHLWVGDSSSATDFVTNFATASSDLMAVGAAWPNNSKVWIEVFNEYSGSDEYARAQTLIDTIRGTYTNPVVMNRFQYWSSGSWQTLTGTNVYQGYHFYFNDHSPTTAINTLQAALDMGITDLICTEVGAHWSERNYFTHSNVSELNLFMDWCYDNSVGFNVWLREDTENWASYQAHGIQFPELSTPETPTPPLDPVPDPDPPPDEDLTYEEVPEPPEPAPSPSYTEPSQTIPLVPSTSTIASNNKMFKQLLRAIESSPKVDVKQIFRVLKKAT